MYYLTDSPIDARALGMATRIVVLRGGEVVGELPRARATPSAVAHLMTGVELAPATA